MRESRKLIVCYVTDRRSLLSPRATTESEAALVQQIDAAVRAGVDWVQIREKDLPARSLLDLTRAAIRTCAPPGRPGRARILVNDRMDVAWAAGAGGVHATETSLPIPALIEARRASGRADFLVGASCHSLRRVESAAAEGADYVFFGPVFATPSKAEFGPPQGLAALAEACKAVSIPVLAIGGITLETCRACADAGAAGVAAIRPFQQSRDLPEIVARLRAP